MEKKEVSNEIDKLIVNCAVYSKCDETQLKELAIVYAQFRCPYLLSQKHMRSLESEEERNIAVDMEQKVNDIIDYENKKKRIGQQIYTLIVNCAVKNQCDENVLTKLALNYSKLNCPYRLSETEMRALDGPGEANIAVDMEKIVNDIIDYENRRGGKSKRRSIKRNKKSRIYK
jgi:hypothetical protein